MNASLRFTSWNSPPIGPAGRGRSVGFLVGQDDQAIASGTRNDAREFLARAQQGDVARQIHVGMDVYQRQGQGDDPQDR
jgi:hypothetical protein